jgi:hypothetical protein
MSLNWDITRVENSEEVFSDENKAVSESIIFYTLFVGMNSITEENVKNFFQRVYVFEKLFGPTVTYVDKNNERRDRYMKFSDIKRMIGLRTNATPMTETKFKSKVVERSYSEASSLVRVAMGS